MPFWLKFVTVVVDVAIADVCTSMYIMATAAYKPLASGLWAVTLIFTGAYATIAFIQDYTMIFGSALGAFIGTTLTVLWHKKRKEKGK